MKRAPRTNHYMLTVLRDGSEARSYMARIRSCSYPAGLMEHAAVNALADGKSVAVTTAAMDFIETDEELAYLLGHELALAARAGYDTAGVSTFW